MSLQTGKPAPHIKTGSFDLANLRGKTVVLFFFPKADTPGCTKESCAFRDAQKQFTKLNAEIVQADARDFGGSAPFVLIDAPCTATGTIRRHPDLPWIKGAADVTVSAGAAYEILESGARMVAPGGTLVFAVCSLEREEGEELPFPR